MQILTEEKVKEYRETYLSDKRNRELTQKYKERAISDIAFNKAKAELQKWEFSVDIATMRAIPQGYAGRCWMIAGLNLLREKVVKKMDKNLLPDGEFAFSAAYLCFWDKMEKANCFLEKVIQTAEEPYHNQEVYSWFQCGITDGGFWTYFTDLVRKYGLVPAEIMPETYQSSNTEELNNRLNYYIRKTGADIRNASRQGKETKELYLIKEKAMQQIFPFLCRCYGCPPEAFSYSVKYPDGGAAEKMYTPKAFYEELLEDYVEQFTNVLSLPYEKLPFGEKCMLDDVFMVAGMQEEVFLNLDLEELKAYCIRQLRDGIPVVCVADDDKMCSEELQLWDDASFDYEEVAGFSFDMSRRDYFQLKAGGACHGMMITGVHIGEDGKPQRWKIENSYGLEGIHKGYYICSDSWFDKYMVSAVIHKNYLDKYQGKMHGTANILTIRDIL